MSLQAKHRRSLVSTSHLSHRFGYKSDDEQHNNFKINHKSLGKPLPKWNQSATTWWKHASPKHSFPKSQRFKMSDPACLDIVELQNKSSLSKVACTFGKGNKTPISIVTLKNAKLKPSPHQYSMENFDQSTRKLSQGKTISKDIKFQDKIYNPIRKDTYSAHFTIDYPSSKYNVAGDISKNSKQIKIHQRLKIFTARIADSQRHVPGPYHLVKDRHLYLMNGLNQRSFGFGDKLDLSKPANQNPGPHYNIERFCDTLKTIS